MSLPNEQLACLQFANPIARLLLTDFSYPVTINYPATSTADVEIAYFPSGIPSSPLAFSHDDDLAVISIRDGNQTTDYGIGFAFQTRGKTTGDRTIAYRMPASQLSTSRNRGIVVLKCDEANISTARVKERLLQIASLGNAKLEREHQRIYGFPPTEICSLPR